LVICAEESRCRQEVVTTLVWFAALTDDQIKAYVATGEPLACAGGFALEGRGGMVVDRIEGCYSNVIGLSLPLLRRWLNADNKKAPSKDGSFLF
jgi:septum formation protein